MNKKNGNNESAFSKLLAPLAVICAIALLLSSCGKSGKAAVIKSADKVKSVAKSGGEGGKSGKGVTGATKLLSDEDFEIKLENGGAVIVSFLSDYSYIAIPAELGGCPVRAVADGAFSGCDKLCGVILPDTLEDIGVMAFGDCVNLSSVNIPSGVVNIASLAFGGCSSLKGFTLSEGNTSLCERDGVIFTSDMKELLIYPCGSDAEEYAVPEGVEKIADGAFAGSLSLVSLTLPSTLGEIGLCAFEACPSLTSIEVSPGASFVSNGGVLFTADSKELAAFPSGRGGAYRVPDGTEYIGRGAFALCTSLTDIVLPERLIAVRAYAFSGCESLKTVKLPTSLAAVEHYAFSDCLAIEKVTYPGTLEKFRSIDIGEGNYCLTNASLSCAR